MSIQIEQLSEEEREEIINYGIRRSIVISISTIVTISRWVSCGYSHKMLFSFFHYSVYRIDGN